MNIKKPGFDLVSVKQWEYLEIVSSTQKRFVGHGLSSNVIDAGRDGWELVTIIVSDIPKFRSEERWIFKRELITER